MTPKRRASLLRLQEGLCFYCGTPMITTGSDPSRMDTIDEVMPRSRGGRCDRDNQVLACKGCNEAKGARLPTDAELQRLAELIARLPATPIPRWLECDDTDFDDT